MLQFTPFETYLESTSPKADLHGKLNDKGPKYDIELLADVD